MSYSHTTSLLRSRGRLEVRRVFQYPRWYSRSIGIIPSNHRLHLGTAPIKAESRNLRRKATDTTPLLRFGFADCARTQGKSEVKRAAFSELRLNPYSSRMFFDHHLCNVESKSYTATIAVM